MAPAVLAAEQLACAFAAARDDLIRTLASLLGDGEDAQDAAQEAFLKCWRHRDQLGQVRDLKAWIFRVGLNAARDLRRNVWRQRWRPLPVGDFFADGGAGPVRQAGLNELLARLQDEVARLRPEERDVFLLRHQSHLTYEQMAHLRRTPVGTIKTRMRAALRKLRGALDDVPG